MRTRYEYIIKSVKFYRGGESLYAAYDGHLDETIAQMRTDQFINAFKIKEN